MVNEADMDSRGSGQGNGLESSNAIVSQLAARDAIPWYHKPNLRLLYLLMLPTCLGVEMTSGFDASMMNGLQAVPSWIEYYHHPHSASLGLMTAMYSLGALGALPFASSIADKLGRRFPIFFGGAISIIAATLQGFALNFTMFIFARFILGFANIFCIVGASSLIAELAHPKERAILSCLFCACYDFGSVAAAWVTLGTFSMTSNWGWRIPSLLQAVFSLLQVSFIWFLPESPRWLISKGRVNEAYATLVKYHAEGNINSDFVKAEYDQIEQTLEAELKIARIGQRKSSSALAMRRRIVIATFLGLFNRWSGIDLISYYLSPILDSIGIHDYRTKHIINLARFSWSLVTGIVSSFIAPRYPRRRVFLSCSLSLLVVFTAWTAASAEYSFTQSKVSAQVVLALIFLYTMAYNVAFGALPYCYLVELFPFHTRAKGVTIYQWSLRSAAFVNQFANSIGIDAFGWRWYITYCVWNAFQVVIVYFMFPETSGRTLEELTFLYEDEQDGHRHIEAERLRDQRTIETYGTTEITCNTTP